jgi:AI-2 transport protein TqsA
VGAHVSGNREADDEPEAAGGRVGFSNHQEIECRRVDLERAGGFVEAKAQFSGAAALLSIFVVLAACKLAQSVIEPVVFALFVIAIVWPLANALQKRVPGWAALLLTVTISLICVSALFWMIGWGGHQVAEWTTANLDRAEEVLVSSTSWLEEHDIYVMSMIKENVNPSAIIQLLHAVAARVNTALAFSFIVLLFVVMGLAETPATREKIAASLDQDTTRRLLAAAKEISEKFQKYMLVRTVASIATGVATWGFIKLLGLQLAAAWGVLAFALNYLPYIGSLIVTVLPPVTAFVETGSPETALLVLVCLMVIQFFIGSYLEPVFSGSALAISPSVVMFSVLLWSYIWGLLGAFLGVPIAIATLTLCEKFPSTHWIAEIFSGEPSKDSKSAGLSA